MSDDAERDFDELWQWHALLASQMSAAIAAEDEDRAEFERLIALARTTTADAAERQAAAQKATELLQRIKDRQRVEMGDLAAGLFGRDESSRLFGASDPERDE